jgi:hypothetical protein
MKFVRAEQDRVANVISFKLISCNHSIAAWFSSNAFNIGIRVNREDLEVKRLQSLSCWYGCDIIDPR